MIQFKNVSKQFGEKKILNGIDLSIDKGQIVFILGTSGTGKSVLLKHLVGLLSCDAGEIWLDGDRIDQFSQDEFQIVRKKCGMVFQHPALFDSLSVYENVASGLRYSGLQDEKIIQERVYQALSLVHIGCDKTLLVHELSYGMQKRVSLARTLVLEPQVLLFDEPTTGLDPIMTQITNQLIQELSRKLNVTSLVVSHDMKCAMNIADFIYVLDRGKVLDQGAPQQILQSSCSLVRDFMKGVRADAE